MNAKTLRKPAQFDASTVLVYTLLVLISFVILLPVLWIVMASFKAGSGLYSSNFFPKELTLDNYVQLFTKTDFPLWFGNSFRIAVLNTVVCLLFTAITGYSFSRWQFKAKKGAMLIVLVLQMFPSFLTMIAIFIILDKLGLLDTYWGLILIYASAQLPYNAWLVKGYFDGISVSLDEAARIDGADEFTIFWRVLLPLARPILVLVALGAFMMPWFDFIFPKLILRGGNTTLAVGIFEWIQYRASDQFTLFAAASILVAVPAVALFAYLQKYIVSGLAAGGVKG
ncbi:MAG: sugar ABC transporter permease [Spirochaetales bacterium]